MNDFAAARERMVREQIAGRGLDDPRLLAAFRQVPREAFVALELSARAYEDGPLPIAAGQTISQPYIVAAMIAAAGVRHGQHVLEVGAGSGYAAAVLSRIAASVVAVERHAELATVAGARLARLGFANVQVVAGDGTLGWPPAAPYQAILASAAGDALPDPLLRQLAPRGVLVMPLGSPGGPQRLVRAVRRGPERWESEALEEVRFVPLIGRHGWPPERA